MAMRLALLTIALVVSACESSITAVSDRRSQPKSAAGGWSLFPTALASAAELPACDGITDGLLVFAGAEQAFYVCDANAWSAIDLRGPKGDKGDPGAKGDVGAEGEAGAAGTDGTNGSNSLDGVVAVYSGKLGLTPSAKKVGIGTTNPDKHLEVVGAAAEDNTEIVLSNRSTNQYSSALISFHLLETEPQEQRWQIMAEKGTAGAATGRSNFQIRRSSLNGSEAVTPLLINEAGNVILLGGYRNGSLLSYGSLGVGTDAPAAKTHILADSTADSGETATLRVESTYNQVASTASNTDLLIRRAETNVGSGGQFLMRAIANDGDILWLQTSGNLRLMDGEDGAIELNPNDGAIQLASANNAFSFIDFTGSSNLGADYVGRLSYGDGEGFRFFTGQSATPTVTITEDGRMGVNNDGPQRPVHINDVMRLEPRAAAPGSPALGDIFVHTSGALCFYNGLAWDELNPTGSCP